MLRWTANRALVEFCLLAHYHPERALSVYLVFQVERLLSRTDNSTKDASIRDFEEGRFGKR